MPRTCAVGIMSLGTMTLAITGIAARAADELPKYRLEPGMELTYKGSSTFRHQSGIHVNEGDTTAWVVRRNSDGSLRIVIRQGSLFTASSNSALDTIKSLFTKKNKPLMQYQFGYFDLFTDGRLGPDSELGYRISPSSLFPRLPDDQATANAGWGQADERMGQEFHYSALATEPEGYIFHAARIGPENKVYETTMDTTYHFSAKRGAIRRVETEYTQGYGFKGKGTGSTELTAVEIRDTAWLTSFAPAADRYFAALKAYDRMTEEASKSAAKANDLLADAKAALKKARDTIDNPVFREQLDRQIAEHDGMASYYADSAKRRAEVLGKPAAEWELEGLDGKKHALANYRGKVVVLDFWYRGCGWCIKAMPQLNALAEEFAGRPVAVLGMNTDRNQDDAKLVVNAMKLKYDTLRAEGIPEKYGVQGFPTLILIDRAGKVSDVHVGYSPTLRADLAKQIEGMLPPK